MTRRITEADVRKVARLARLELSEAEVPLLTDQLEAILGYVATLQRMDLDDVEGLSNPSGLGNRLGDDRVADSLEPGEVLTNAPMTEGPFIAVPKVIQEGSGS